ncbi:hypothetical protein LSH36_258g05077 [Paralvinella palmiformis]|uniref:Chitin-binding type-2 domain-containing protein n=1 Tax=Paralvinella palmiformis TaxID=53620 RepID=A0AAD9JKL2_9ANNE|nr:hypothetical protein LSH36_258g05077 [Paralvinella palmiformis]
MSTHRGNDVEISTVIRALNSVGVTVEESIGSTGSITGSCAELGDGLYPIVTDCTKYLWCFPSGQTIKSCGVNTVFLTDIQTCGYPIECSQNVIRKAPTQDVTSTP